MQQRTLFTNANLFDGKGARQPGMTVAIEGAKIVAVGSEIPSQEGDRNINLGGKTVMPGMTVGHWHGEFVEIGAPLCSKGGTGTFAGEEKPPAILALQYANALRIALMSGVTQVVCAAGGHDHDIQMQIAVESGLIEGPHITPCSRHITTTGNDEDRGKWWASSAPPRDGIRRVGTNVFVDGVPDMIKAVREEILFGADIIKVLPNGGHGFAWTGSYRGLSNAELRAVVETAHEGGKRVRAHATTRESILECLDAGVDLFDQGDYLDEECIERMVEKGVIFAPSIAFTKFLACLKTDNPSDMEDPDQRAWLNMKKMLPKAHKAGLKIIPGDDYGAQGMPHELGIYARDLEIFVNDIGIPAADVLRWATAGGAELTRRDPVAGTIEAGKLADILVVDGDPTENIALLTDPRRYLKAIMRNGRFLRDEL